MISLFTGTPGSGKSLDVARLIYYKLKMGKRVIGNMRVRPESIARCRGTYIYVATDELTPYQLYAFARRYHVKGKENQTYIVIDECQDIFNSREWAKPERKEWNHFFQMHRHLGFSVWLIVQYDRLIDRQIRAMVQTEYFHRKIANLGMKGKLLNFIFKLFRKELFVKIGKDYESGVRLGAEYFTYSKKYGEFYDSYAFFDNDVIVTNELKPYLGTVRISGG